MGAYCELTSSLRPMPAGAGHGDPLCAELSLAALISLFSETLSIAHLLLTPVSTACDSC